MLSWKHVSVVIMSILSHSRELVECAHEFASHLKLVDIGVWPVMLRDNREYRTIDSIPVTALVSIRTRGVKNWEPTSASWS